MTKKAPAAAGEHVTVIDAAGRPLSPCSAEKAARLLAEGHATLVSEAPFIIQLPRCIEFVEALPTPQPKEDCADGRRLLLHICCAPCATYSVQRFRLLGFDVAGFWYNPNIHPWQEHERRRESLHDYALRIGLPMTWATSYDMPQFLRAVAGKEQFRRRCAICYGMRLAETARRAREGGFDAFSTTLLISPHQEQDTIRRLGESIAEAEGVEFYFENLRRGWSERGRLTRQYDLYRQQYCGCIYSEWERYNGVHIDAILPAERPAPGGDDGP